MLNNGDGDSENLLDELFSTDTKKTNPEIIKLLDDEEKQEGIFDIVIDKIEEVKNVKEERNRKKAVLKRVQKANSLLVEANNIKSSETDKTGIVEQIKQIREQILDIENWATK